MKNAMISTYPKQHIRSMQCRTWQTEDTILSAIAIIALLGSMINFLCRCKCNTREVEGSRKEQKRLVVSVLYMITCHFLVATTATLHFTRLNYD